VQAARRVADSQSTEQSQIKAATDIDAGLVRPRACQGLPGYARSVRLGPVYLCLTGDRGRCQNAGE
jgi:hypothetical protein